MKKKVLFNIALILIFTISLSLFVLFISTEIVDTWLKRYQMAKNDILTPANDHVAELIRLELVRSQNMLILGIISIVFFALLDFFSIFMLIYINKKDITVLSASVVDKMKEQRKQKAKEKKQQKIDALEEQLKQLKKDE